MANATINLLRQHGACQFVRKRHGGERNQLVRARPPSRRRAAVPLMDTRSRPSISAFAMTRANPAESIGLPAGSRKILRAEGCFSHKSLLGRISRISQGE